MKFGPVTLSRALGKILAHSVAVDGKRLRKGRTLSETDLEVLKSSGVRSVTVASLEEGDIGEDQAARRVGEALISKSRDLSISAPFTGRVNVYSAVAGVCETDVGAVVALNQIDPAITLATLPNLSRVVPRMLVGTIKIITYGVPEANVIAAADAAAGILSVRKVIYADAGLVITRVAGQPMRLAKKGLAAVEQRLGVLGIRLSESQIVNHDPGSVGDALKSCSGSLLLILTGSATSDPEDVGPEGLRLAGGRLHRFGIPVDPGNLLFFGELGERPVIGLPGCARSPALNGADWVLERTSCGIPIRDFDFAAMGAGGLLKEIPVRPQPRGTVVDAVLHPKVEAVVVVDEPDGLDEILANLTKSKVDRCIVVSTEDFGSRLADKAGPRLKVISAHSGSVARGDALRLGVSSVSDAADAVILIRSDGRIPAAQQLDRMIAAYSPPDGREICRLATAEGHLGPPILFGRRFFESLAGVSGNRGAADLVVEASDYVVEIAV